MKNVAPWRMPLRRTAEKETAHGCPRLEKLLRCEVQQAATVKHVKQAEREYRWIHYVIQSIRHSFTLPSPERDWTLLCDEEIKIKNESGNSVFLCCDGKERGRERMTWENNNRKRTPHRTRIWGVLPRCGSQNVMGTCLQGEKHSSVGKDTVERRRSNNDTIERTEKMVNTGTGKPLLAY